MERRFKLRLNQVLDDAVVDPVVFRGVLPRLERFVQPFAEGLHRQEQEDHLQHYLAGLVSNLDRKNVESIAIEPANPDVIYAGTWHLPWKTSDGGKTWHNIKAGLIDDSDIFSIIIDPARPEVVYASACSGIYKSESGGEIFHKIQGIPFSARRTRVLKQDPANSSVVYAGTTEGLWKTSNAGKNSGYDVPDR